jgi:hypothetical protein
MFSLTRGRALATLVLALATVMAVTPVLTASADTGAAAAAKKPCKKKKGKAKGSAAKGCKKGKAKAKKPSSGAPKPGTRLTGPNTLVVIALQYPGPIPIVSVTIRSVPATCSDGTTKPIIASAYVPIKSASFSGSQEREGYTVTISGTFTGETKVTGTLSMTPIPGPNGVTCTIAPQQFTLSK